jgi:hypothetical protein
MGFVNLFSGYKTYIAAIGLVGLSVYQASTGDFSQSFQTLMSALAAAGLRSAIAAQATSKAS